MPHRTNYHRPPIAKAARPTAAARGYDAEWRRIRAAVLAEEPLCRLCSDRGETTAATCVDHIRPQSKGGTHDRENLRPLCSRCHAKYGDQRGRNKPPGG